MSTAVREFAEVTARLCAEFGELPRHRVERCVADVCACASHLGFDLTPGLVEKVAREHLAGAVKSRPPSTSLPKQRYPTALPSLGGVDEPRQRLRRHVGGDGQRPPRI